MAQTLLPFNAGLSFQSPGAQYKSAAKRTDQAAKCCLILCKACHEQWRRASLSGSPAAAELGHDSNLFCQWSALGASQRATPWMKKIGHNGRTLAKWFPKGRCFALPKLQAVIALQRILFPFFEKGALCPLGERSDWPDWWRHVGSPEWQTLLQFLLW